MGPSRAFRTRSAITYANASVFLNRLASVPFVQERDSCGGNVRNARSRCRATGATATHTADEAWKANDWNAVIGNYGTLQNTGVALTRSEQKRLDIAKRKRR